MPKLYSVAEANALLPEITDLLRNLQQQVAALAHIETEIKAHRKLVQTNGHGAEGRMVYLCWRLGEPEVLFWHDLDSGFAGRQLLT